MTRRQSLIIVMVAGSAILGWFLVSSIISDILSDPFGYPWTRDDINNLLKVQIPQDATDFKFSGRQGLGASLDLSFKAPPASANNFANAICAVLYQGYDPFEAINIGAPFTYAYLISVGRFPYYSYSPHASQTVFGNRCGDVYQMRIDKANANSYEIWLQAFFSCEICYPPIVGDEVRPNDNFPIFILGLKQAGNIYLSSAGEICVNVNLPTPTQNNRHWAGLINAHLEISIDMREVGSATVLDAVRLASRHNSQGNPVLEDKSGNFIFYCLPIGSGNGHHTLKIDIKTVSGIDYSYSWEFLVYTSQQQTPIPAKYRQFPLRAWFF